MAKNVVLIVLLVFALFATYSNSQDTTSRSGAPAPAGIAAAPAPGAVQPAPVQQAAVSVPPAQAPGTVQPVQFALAQQPSAPPPQPGQIPASAPPSLPGQVQASAGQPKDASAPPPALPQNLPQATPQQNTMPMGGMGCMTGGMSGMGGMGGMNGMNGMGGMSGMGSMGMSHNMDQGFSMREIIYVVSMQDALQVMGDMIQLQEKILDNAGPKKESLKQELAEIKAKTQKLASDYRSMLTSSVRGQ